MRDQVESWLEDRLDPEECDARREGSSKLEGDAASTCSVVTKATELACGDQEIQKIVNVGFEHVQTCMQFVKEQTKANR